jgi:cytochrome c oxidase cbb3-type subunit 2
MRPLSVEANLGKLMIGALLFFAAGAFLTVILPPLVADWDEPLPGQHPLTAQAAHGRERFIAEGCTGCHTQQVRRLETDMRRFGWRGTNAPPSKPAEYATQQPHQLGTRRVGPDLSHVGGKYDSSWHYAHLTKPRDMVPGSVMPSFRYLGAGELRALTAYLQTLGRAHDWRSGQGDYEQ